MADAPRNAPTYVIDGPLPPCRGYQQLDATALIGVVSLTVPNQTTMVLLQAEGNSVRWRADEVDPSVSVGMLIASGGEVLYASSQDAIAKLRFTRGGAGAILNASFY